MSGLTHSRGRLAAVAAFAAAAAVAAVLLLAGGAEGDGAALEWSGAQRVDSGRAGDEIVAGRLENASLKDVELDVRDVRVLDADGKVLKSAVRFREAFAHGIFPWSLKPDDVGDFERRRLGEVATVRPGQSIPVTLSWRVPAGAAPAARVELGPDALAIPAR